MIERGGGGCDVANARGSAPSTAMESAVLTFIVMGQKRGRW